MSWLRSKSPQGYALRRMQRHTDAQMTQALYAPTKHDLQDLLAEAVRNTVKLSTTQTGENDASHH